MFYADCEISVQPELLALIAQSVEHQTFKDYIYIYIYIYK